MDRMTPEERIKIAKEMLRRAKSQPGLPIGLRERVRRVAHNLVSLNAMEARRHSTAKDSQKSTPLVLDNHLALRKTPSAFDLPAIGVRKPSAAARFKDGLVGFAVICTPLAVMILWYTLFPLDPYNPKIFDFARDTFEACAMNPTLHRTVRCDAYVKFWEDCSASGSGRCSIDEAHKILSILDFEPPQVRLSPK